MPLKRLPYKNLKSLIAKNLYSHEEEVSTVKLIRELRPAKKRGYLTKKEMEIICRWKSPRAIRLIQSNGAQSIRAATTVALESKVERVKIEALTSLKGVSLPMASAMLMLLDPTRYGVIDIRVWELLHKIGSVDDRPSGVGFVFRHWYRYLMIIRHYARVHAVSARDIERTLFLVHKAHQKGSLYRSVAASAKSGRKAS